MREKKEETPSEKKSCCPKAKPAECIEVGLLLSFVGGYLDAYTFITRNGVFANTQTGNIILFAISLASGNYRAMLQYLIPIIFFFLAGILTEVFKKTIEPRIKGLMRCQEMIIIIEMMILTIIGLLPHSIPDLVVTTTISFVCSMQVDAFQKLQGMPYATTMCTGNLRSSAENCYMAMISKEKRKGRDYLVKFILYLAIILSFSLGVAIGILITRTEKIYENSVLTCSAVLLVVLAILLIRRKFEYRHNTDTEEAEASAPLTENIDVAKA